jgi:cytochrome bd-type quinol oxidase subunit 1
MEWTRGVTVAVFLVFGYFCIGMLFYLLISWLCGIKLFDDDYDDIGNINARIRSKLTRIKSRHSGKSRQ